MRRWSGPDLLLAFLLSIAFSVLYVAWDVIWEAMAFSNTIQPGLQELFYGFWLSAAIVGAFHIRRPGAALLVQSLAVLAEMSLRGRWHVIPLVGGLVQAALAEGVFALGSYKRYDLRTGIAAGAAAALGSMIFDLMLQSPDTAWPAIAVPVAARIASGASLAGWLGKTLAAAMDRARSRKHPAEPAA